MYNTYHKILIFRGWKIKKLKINISSFESYLKLSRSILLIKIALSCSKANSLFKCVIIEKRNLILFE